MIVDMAISIHCCCSTIIQKNGDNVLSTLTDMQATKNIIWKLQTTKHYITMCMYLKHQYSIYVNFIADRSGKSDFRNINVLMWGVTISSTFISDIGNNAKQIEPYLSNLDRCIYCSVICTWKLLDLHEVWIALSSSGNFETMMMKLLKICLSF